MIFNYLDREDEDDQVINTHALPTIHRPALRMPARSQSQSISNAATSVLWQDVRTTVFPKASLLLAFPKHLTPGHSDFSMEALLHLLLKHPQHFHRVQRLIFSGRDSYAIPNQAALEYLLHLSSTARSLREFRSDFGSVYTNGLWLAPLLACTANTYESLVCLRLRSDYQIQISARVIMH